MKWNDENTAKLKELVFAGKSNKEIAQVLEIDVNDVYNKRSQLGITMDKVKAAIDPVESNAADDEDNVRTKDEVLCKKQTWQEFRNSGLLWWINMILHTFGWAIVFEVDNKEITVYPARVRCRGFDEDGNTKGYIKVSQYLKENADDLLKEAKE